MTRVEWPRCVTAGLLVASSLLSQTADTAATARRAVELQQSGDYAGAVAAYREVTSKHPGDIVARVNLGVSLVQLGRFDEAIVEYQAADRLLPNDSRIALNLALAYLKSGRLQEATNRFESLHSAIPDDSKVTLLLADCHLQQGDDRRVVELLAPLAPRLTDDLGVAYMLGMALLHTGKVAEGQVFLDRILHNGDSAEARFLLGTRMFEAGDFPAAVRQLASAAELNPKLPQLQALYGRALLYTGDPDAAAMAFRRELETNPNSFAASLGLGQILSARKQISDAIAFLRRALLLRPDSPDVRREMAAALADAGRYQEALPLAEASVKASPDSPEAHRVLATIYNGLHRIQQGGQELRTATSLASQAAAASPGPKSGDLAPEFELPDPAASRKVRLRDFRGKSPVLLVFGSYSCPNFRASAAELNRLQKIYGARVPFLLVYIREAHSDADWQSTRNVRDNISTKPAGTMNEKEGQALLCRRQLHLSFPAVVDGLDGAVEKSYDAWPSRAFLVDRQGRIRYSTHLTELDFHAADLELWLHRVSKP